MDSGGISTHVDAASHYTHGKRSIDQYRLDELIVAACVINVTNKCENNHDYGLTVDDIKQWESQYGSVPSGCIVLLYTGWSKYWSEGQDKYVPIENHSHVGNDRPHTCLCDNSGVVRHFPGYTAAAAKYLIDKRVVAIGIDTLSADVGINTDMEVHKLTGEADIYMVENLNTRLGELQPTGHTLIVAPINIVGGSEATARVFAYC